MDELKVMPKPDWVTWEDIHELLVKANKVNERKGFSMADLNLPPEKLEQQVANGGLCVVALFGEKLVGVTACNFVESSIWLNKGKKVVRKFMSGILKSYQGCGIMKKMDMVIDDYIRSTGCEVIMASTAENNYAVRKGAALGGYKELAYESFKGVMYYSVIFAKWLTPCPYPDWYVKFRFFLSRSYVKARFKIGRVERLWILECLKKSLKKKK